MSNETEILKIYEIAAQSLRKTEENVINKFKENHMWIDVQDQLPKDEEEVWVCMQAQDYHHEKYIQLVGKFRRSQGWITVFGSIGKIHYWMPKPKDPPLPNWCKHV